ncbi:hypothetical protein ACQ86G_02055 [Roseateles chitinivorans]|uniref:hypothetical protein n=1 Tax=Roseateles chitinivorans TaxID=2917965 RepID=UPI003D6707A6
MSATHSDPSVASTRPVDDGDDIAILDILATLARHRKMLVLTPSSPERWRWGRPT